MGNVPLVIALVECNPWDFFLKISHNPIDSFYSPTYYGCQVFTILATKNEMRSVFGDGVLSSERVDPFGIC